jgi:hypothetical protein
MPTFYFTEEESGTIGQYFSALDNVPYPFISTGVQTTPAKLAAGAELFRILQCASCHPTSNQIPPGKTAADLAPNLMIAHERLRPAWVLDWVLDPQRIMPGTRMPAFFNPQTPGGPRVSQVPNILNGDVTAQIEALRDHLFVTLGGGRPASSGSTN